MKLFFPINDLKKMNCLNDTSSSPNIKVRMKFIYRKAIENEKHVK